MAEGVKITMDGRGRFVDNIFVERLWRSLKYERVYLRAWSGGREARDGIGQPIKFYNQRRPHTALGGRTADQEITRINESLPRRYAAAAA